MTIHSADTVSKTISPCVLLSATMLELPDFSQALPCLICNGRQQAVIFFYVRMVISHIDILAVCVSTLSFVCCVHPSMS